jgi:hypothetical protein
VTADLFDFGVWQRSASVDEVVRIDGHAVPVDLGRADPEPVEGGADVLVTRLEVAMERLTATVDPNGEPEDDGRRTSTNTVPSVAAVPRWVPCVL